VCFFEIFDDRERLREQRTFVFERWHQALRIQGQIGGQLLLATVAHQMHRQLLGRQALQIQGNTDAIGGRRTKVGVELHASASRFQTR